jgi:hypothetical protein
METISSTNKIRSREAGAGQKRDPVPFSLAHLIALCAFFACNLRQQREVPHSAAARERLSAIPITIGYRLHGER